MTKRIITYLYKQTARMMILPGLLFVLSAMPGCKNDPKDIIALTSKNITQQDKAQDVTIIYSEHGNVKAQLFAHQFVDNETAKPPYIDMKNGLKAQFFDSGVVTSTLTARYARYYTEQGNVVIRDSVMVVNNKGEALHTEELVWNEKLRKFYTEKFVRINTPTQVLYGDGLEANEDFTWYHINNLKGTVHVDKSEVPQ